MCSLQLKIIIDKLHVFESLPKKIEGRQITDWFQEGESIFNQFFELGRSIQWDYSLIKGQHEIRNVVIYIIKNQEWLQTFLNLYPLLRIDLDVVCSAGDLCRIRSGIEVLLRGLTGVDSDFDTTLKNLEELGEVDELDRCLKIWVNTGHRPDFTSEEKQLSAPQAHWWWH